MRTFLSWILVIIAGGSLTSCEAIGDIFSAGVYAGMFIVVAIVVVIIVVIVKIGKK